MKVHEIGVRLEKEKQAQTAYKVMKHCIEKETALECDLTGRPEYNCNLEENTIIKIEATIGNYVNRNGERTATMKIKIDTNTIVHDFWEDELQNKLDQ